MPYLPKRGPQVRIRDSDEAGFDFESHDISSMDFLHIPVKSSKPFHSSALPSGMSDGVSASSISFDQ